MQSPRPSTPRGDVTTDETTIDVWEHVPIPPLLRENAATATHNASNAARDESEDESEPSMEEALAHLGTSGGGGGGAVGAHSPGSFVGANSNIMNNNNNNNNTVDGADGVEATSLRSTLGRSRSVGSARGSPRNRSPRGGARDGSQGASPPKGGAALLTESYRMLLGSKLHCSPAVQVVYKMEVPVGRAETFMAAFWKHENTLRTYCTQVTICRSTPTEGKARKLDFGEGAAAPTASEEQSDRQRSTTQPCRACVEEGRADCCTDFIPGPLRRHKDDPGRIVRTSSDVAVAVVQEDPVYPAAKDGGIAALTAPSTPGLSDSSLSSSAGGGGGGGVGPKVVAASALPNLVSASSPPPPSPSKRKTGTPVRGARTKRRGPKFERRCRVCDHAPLDHASAVTTFTLYLDFKTRAAWESAFSTFDDVASEGMKDCVARAFEPTVYRIVDEHFMQPVSLDDGMAGSLEDEDMSAASESATVDHASRGELENREFFRFTLWKALHLPTNADGSPHTWVVQVKFGKSILTSSAKTANDPVWKEHFHFKYKEGRKLYLRIIAQDQPKQHEGRLKIRMPTSSSARSRTGSLRSPGRTSFQDERGAQSPRPRSSSGRLVEARPSSASMGKRAGAAASQSLPSAGPSVPATPSPGMVPPLVSPRLSGTAPITGVTAVPSSAPDANNSNNNNNNSNMDSSAEGGAEDDLWAEARQWRPIQTVEGAKGGRHGQMLVSLQMGVQLLDPRVLHSVVKDEEPEGVADVLPQGNGWAVFRDIQPKLATGDVVLFAGYGWVGSTLHKYEQRPWLHLGMVMVFPEYDMILVWEFAPGKSLEVSNKVTGHFKLNVQLTDINTKLRDARYLRVAVRKLECMRTPEMLHDLMKLKKKLEAEGFQGSLPKLVTDRGELSPSDDLSAIFSSELLATAFRAMRLLPAQGDLLQYGPDFWAQDKVIELEGGAKLLPCLHVERTFDPVTRSMNVK